MRHRDTNSGTRNSAPEPTPSTSNAKHDGGRLTEIAKEVQHAHVGDGAVRAVHEFFNRAPADMFATAQTKNPEQEIFQSAQGKSSQRGK